MKQFRASIWKEGDWYVAQCLEVDVASQGKSEELAVEALKEALQLHFMPPVATITPRVTTLEVEIGAA
jgi:predicted RNase H-like HicB family nuclease